jgi:hypothetical protein
MARHSGWSAALLAFAANALLSRVPGLADLAETDLLHGHPYATIGALGLTLILAAPYRSRGTMAKTLHGIALGTGAWWSTHFLFHADLAARADRTLAVLLTLVLAAVLAALGGASLIITATFKRWFQSDRSGAGPLKALEIILLGSSSQVEGCTLPGWIATGLRLYHRTRHAIGRETTRSHAIERAFEASLNETTLGLRRALEKRSVPEILIRSNEVAAAAVAELAMFELIRRFAPETPPAPQWPSRLVKAWDLLSWGEWITQSPPAEARATLLGKIGESTAISPWLRATARALLNRQITQQAIRQLEQHIRPDATGEELFGAALLLEGLVDAQLATWSSDFLERARNVNPPKWISPTLARIQMQAEAQILGRQAALGPEETAVRRALHSTLLLRADAPGLDQQTRSTLVLPLRACPTVGSARSTGALPPLARTGLDLGTGATPVALLSALCLSGAVAVWIQHRPIGTSLKPLIKLSGPTTPAAAPIAAADATPEGSVLVMATRGDGLHRMNATTFRLRAHRPDNGGPSSLWLSDVALSKTGQTGVVTYLPAKEDQGQLSSGADIETAAGWISIIRPTGIRAPDVEKITHVLRIGANKLMREDSRWLVYRTHTRELGEITFRGLPEGADLEITAAAGQADETGHAFVVSRAGSGDNTPPRDRIFELEPGATTEGTAKEITGTFPGSERALQILASGKRLWLRTESKRLYERQDGVWNLRLDADTGLATDRISHAVLSTGPIATLWLVEAAEDGRPVRIRARPLPETDFLPAGGWRIINLTGAPSKAGRQPMGESLKLRMSDAPPVAVFDPVIKQPTLLVPGRSGGLWRFRCDPTPPFSPETATLEAESIATPGERMLTLDASESGIVAVLESEDGTVRRVALKRAGESLGAGLDARSTIVESILPDPAILAGAKILLAANSDNDRRLHLILDSGKIFAWDRQKHGFTSRIGIQATDMTGAEIGPLVSADLSNGKVVVCDARGRVLTAAEADLASDKPRFAVIHEASDIAPPAALRPLHVATTGAGLEVYFGLPGANAGEPWQLAPTPAKGTTGPALLAWRKPNLSEPLNIGTLTRIQDKDGFQNLIALGVSGQLFWRNEFQWMPWTTENGTHRALFNAKGATFAGSAGAIRQIELQNGIPTLGAPLWEATDRKLVRPVTSVAGTVTDGRMLLVGHARGLGLYDPQTRQWRAVPIEPPTALANWTMLANEDGTGSSKAVWVLAKDPNGRIAGISKVSRGVANPLKIGTEPSVALAGDWLAIWDQTKGLRTEGSDGIGHELIPAPQAEVGDAQFRRIVGTKVLHALDEKGRILTADADELIWQVASGSRPTSNYRDIEADGEGHVFQIDSGGRVWRRESLGARDMLLTAEGLQRAGDRVAAFDLTHGAVSLIERSGAITRIAGGRNPAAIIGSDVKASLTHGDTLFLAGAKGAVFRNPQSAQMKPIPASAGIIRFEQVGRDLVAYRGRETSRLTEKAGEYRLEPISTADDSIVTGPDGNIWRANSGEGMAPLTSSPAKRALVPNGLFRSEGMLARQIRQAAPWKNDSAILPGSKGELLHYQPMLRSFFSVQGNEKLPSDWELLRSGNVVVVKSPGSEGNSTLRLISDDGGPSLVLLESEALDVVQHGAAVAWIRKSDRSVWRVEEDAKRPLVTFPETKSGQVDNAPTSQALLASDNTLWALSGRTAFQYSPESQTVVRTVRSVANLAKDGGKVVAIADAPEGSIVLKLESPSATDNLTVTGTGIGETELLRWRDERTSREIFLGPNREQQTPRIPDGLRTPGGSFVAIPNTTLLAWLSDRGHLVTYDYAYARWRQVTNDSGGWTDFGLAGNTLILHRMGAKAAIGTCAEDGQITVHSQAAGPAWFSREGWLEICEPDPAERQMVTTQPDGRKQPVHTFARSTPRFRGSQSGAFESPALRAAILFLNATDGAGMDVWVVSDDNRAIAVSDLPTIRQPEALRVFADATGFVMTVDQSLFHISAADGRFEKIADQVTEVGLVGSRLHYLERATIPSSARFTLRRCADKTVALELGAISHNGERRVVLNATFGTQNGQAVVELATQRDDPGAPDTIPGGRLDLAVTQQGEQLVIVDANGTAEHDGSAGALCYRSGSDHGIAVFQLSLAEDGWFDSQYPVGFEPGTQETDRLGIRMRDATVQTIQLAQPASPRPYRDTGPMTLVGTMIQDSRTGAKLGSVETSESLLLCDAWREARPTSAEAFLTLDALGQVWSWTQDQRGFRRVWVPLPAGLASNGLRLPAAEDGTVVVLDTRNRPAGKFIAGKFLAHQGVESIATPAERAGSFETLAWSKAVASRTLRMHLTASGRNGPEAVPIDFTAAGLSIDRPTGLAVLPNDANLWLRLCSMPDGRWLVCPAEADGISRIAACRLVAPPAPAERNAFSAGSMQFSPRPAGWDIRLAGTKIEISAAGRLAIDEIKRAATLKDGDVTTLLINTGQPGVLVTQSWMPDGRIGKPDLIPTPAPVDDIRTWRGEFLIRTGPRWMARRNNQWQSATPDWATATVGPSKWAYNPTSGKITWEGEEVPTMTEDGALGLAADILTPTTEADGTPHLVATESGEVVYQSISGGWFAWEPGAIVGKKTAAPVLPAGATVSAGVFTFPRRSPALGAYQIRNQGDEVSPLPLALRAGRMPHQDVEKVESWGPEGFRAQLRDNRGSFIFKGDARTGRSRPSYQAGVGEKPPSTPSYDPRTFLELTPEVSLHWKKNSDTFDLVLRTKGSPVDSPLGVISSDGVEIDSPEAIRPVALSEGQIGFVFHGALWSRKTGQGLADFRRHPELIPAESYGPVFDNASDKLTLGTSSIDAGQLYSPWSGKFLSDGRRARTESFTASLEDAGRQGTLVVRRQEPQPVTISIIQTDTGWNMPFAKPIAAFFENNRIALVTTQGDGIGYFEPDGRLSRADRLAKPVTHVWRANGGVEGLRAGGHITQFSRDTDGATIEGEAPENKIRIDDACDAFSLRRAPETGDLRPVWKAAGETRWREAKDWQAHGLPGAWPQGAAVLGEGAVLIADRHGIRRLNMNGGTTQPAIPQSGDESGATLTRNFGAIEWTARGNTGQLATPDNNESGIRLQTAGTTRETIFGKWILTQTTDTGRIAFYFKTETGRSEVFNRHGGLDFDFVSGLFEAGSESWMSSTAGLGTLEQGKFYPAPNQAARNILERPDLGLTRSQAGPEIFSRSETTSRRGLAPGLPLRTTPKGADEYAWIGSESDWSVFRNARGQLTISRPVETEKGQMTDTLAGKEIFSGNQLAFDHVRAIQRDPAKQQDLLLVTDRAIERLSAEGSSTSKIIDLRNQIYRLPPWREVSYANEAKQELRIRDQVLRLPKSAKSDRSQVLDLGSRIWIVEEHAVRWIEGDERWRSLRETNLGKRE